MGIVCGFSDLSSPYSPTRIKMTPLELLKAIAHLL